jgi:hypothetical protein
MGIQSWLKGKWSTAQERFQSVRAGTWTRLDGTRKRVGGWWQTLGASLRKYVAGPTLEEINALSKRIEELAKKVEKVTAEKAAPIVSTVVTASKASAPRVARRSK